MVAQEAPGPNMYMIFIYHGQLIHNNVFTFRNSIYKESALLLYDIRFLWNTMIHGKSFVVVVVSVIFKLCVRYIHNACIHIISTMKR